uniref:Uncharacterized protein n=1 Tax=Tanacetum cinerariifolium TaxID=118510 RepID=A0A699WPF4_TANCI|nr:hypothetical protein [Tanacetum cinerariifolium]
MPVNSIASRDGRLPCHEVVNDDLCESRVVHLIASLLTLVFHLIHKVLPDQHFPEGFQVKNALLCVNLETD